MSHLTDHPLTDLLALEINYILIDSYQNYSLISILLYGKLFLTMATSNFNLAIIAGL